MAKLFIVGIPRDMEEIELVELFSVYGIVNNVTIVTDQGTGESKGYGFVIMADKAGADRAIAALDQAEIDGRTISVRLAEDKTLNASATFQEESLKDARILQHPQSAPRGKRPRLPKR